MRKWAKYNVKRNKTLKTLFLWLIFCDKKSEKELYEQKKIE
jgi:hypothetical protein